MVKLLRKLLSLRPYRIVWTTTPYWEHDNIARKALGMKPVGTGIRKCNPARIYLLTPERRCELEEAGHECLPMSVNIREWERRQWEDFNEFTLKVLNDLKREGGNTK